MRGNKSYSDAYLKQLNREAAAFCQRFFNCLGTEYQTKLGIFMKKISPYQLTEFLRYALAHGMTLDWDEDK